MPGHTLVALDMGVLIDQYEQDLDQLDDEEILIKEEDAPVKVIFDYPLREEFEFIMESPKPEGMTAKDIVSFICQTYHFIYEEEDKTTNVPVSHGPILVNRNFTDGKFGIWGHDLSDLVLTDIFYNPLEKQITFNVDS